MKRREAFKMFLKPGFKEEYKRRHAALWPEMKALLKESGVSNYSIYLDEETGVLYAYQEVSASIFAKSLAAALSRCIARFLESSGSSKSSLSSVIAKDPGENRACAPLISL